MLPIVTLTAILSAFFIAQGIALPQVGKTNSGSGDDLADSGNGVGSSDSGDGNPCVTRREPQFGNGVNGKTNCGNGGAGSGNGVGSSDSGNANTNSLSLQGDTEEGNEVSGILSPDSNFILEKDLEALLKVYEGA
ncbi:hypothetical protein GALMADRAFT_154459 [Galerina marginata CBS 339.88]|uniref:Uncharacterized protein n=1 Tax=Galerina marginata (strain CBS 339.88) TaxID=685588 RepID=A0A067TI92_GALM3|nr:hypothetical protein GALMADRAFT_154459 [Galerina marginata CBS 339.88]